jgi:hypothetical protein
VTEVAPLARKLGIKPEMTAVVLNPPDGVLDLFEPLPAGVRLASSGGRTQSDLVLVFAADAAALTHAWPTTQAAMKPGGLLWIAYPKGGRKAGTDLNRDILWAHMQQHDLVGVTLVAIDGTWSAMRFRRPDEVGKG